MLYFHDLGAVCEGSNGSPPRISRTCHVLLVWRIPSPETGVAHTCAQAREIERKWERGRGGGGGREVEDVFTRESLLYHAYLDGSTLVLSV